MNVSLLPQELNAEKGASMKYDAIVDKYLGLLKHDYTTSELSIAGTAVAFHCDKFNTRILKNLEDVMGFDKAAKMLFEMARLTTYNSFKNIMETTEAGQDIKALSKKEQIEAFLEIFKALAYGAIVNVEYTPERSLFSSEHSYLAEGWLENKRSWKLDAREGPSCHDIRGHLAAVMAIVEGKSVDAYTVSETQCRSFKDGSICEFVAEVK